MSMHLKKLEAEDEDSKLLEAKQTGANIIKLFLPFRTNKLGRFSLKVIKPRITFARKTIRIEHYNTLVWTLTLSANMILA
jgi:hypothetical protein